MLGVPSAFSVTLYRSMIPFVSRSGRTGSATTQPVVEGSVCWTGTGVQPCPATLWSSRLVRLPVLKLLRAGQVVMVALPLGFVIQATSAWMGALRRGDQ
jgi:hypothetical protein